MSLKLPGIGKPFTHYTWTSIVQNDKVYIDITHAKGNTRMELRPDSIWPYTQTIKAAVDKYLTEGQQRHAYKIRKDRGRASYIDFDQLGRFTGDLL